MPNIKKNIDIHPVFRPNEDYAVIYNFDFMIILWKNDENIAFETYNRAIPFCMIDDGVLDIDPETAVIKQALTNIEQSCEDGIKYQTFAENLFLHTDPMSFTNDFYETKAEYENFITEFDKHHLNITQREELVKTND